MKKSKTEEKELNTRTLLSIGNDIRFFSHQSIDADIMLHNVGKRSHYNVMKRQYISSYYREGEVLYSFLTRYYRIYNQ